MIGVRVEGAFGMRPFQIQPLSHDLGTKPAQAAFQYGMGFDRRHDLREGPSVHERKAIEDHTALVHALRKGRNGIPRLDTVFAGLDAGYFGIQARPNSKPMRFVDETTAFELNDDRTERMPTFDLDKLFLAIHP